MEALKFVEARLAKENETGRYCHGDAVTLADICIATQVFGARFFNCDTAPVPTVMRVFKHEARSLRQIAAAEAAGRSKGDQALGQDAMTR